MTGRPQTGATIGILSNGHGEDVIGVQLARALGRICPSAVVKAFPIVGVGAAYEKAGVPLLGPRKALPSGGLTLHHPKLLWRDLTSGLASLTVRQVAQLRRLEFDALIIVGDIYALLLGAMVPAPERYFIQTLVSTRHQGSAWSPRIFMERFTAAEIYLMKRVARQVYVRDEASERQLQGRGVGHVRSFGNPMMDAITPAGEPLSGLSLTEPVVALLPGTRKNAAASLELMLDALRMFDRGTGLVAWAGGELPRASGWREAAGGSELPGVVHLWQRGSRKVYVVRERFAEVIAAAQLAVGTAGTAHEQAAGTGLPVISFPLPPYHTRRFLDNQKRLLGAALTIVPAAASRVAEALSKLWHDPELRARAAEIGRERMGPPGASAAIAEDIARQAGLKTK